MALSSYDFTKGLDFTGLTEATAGDHNNLVDLAVPMSDTASEARSINIWTKDSALNTPIVPNPSTGAGYTKWKKYIWIRKPDSTAADTAPLVYVWDDDAVSDATYLKWVSSTNVDVAGLEADIATAQAAADDAQATADGAAATAATALSTANSAYNLATTAKATADGALAIAQDPLSQIDDGEITAAKLESTLDLSGKTVTLPNGSVTAAMLADSLQLSNKNITLPASLFTLSNSGLLPIPAAGTTVTYEHKLNGATPSQVRWVLYCASGELGYALGDEVDLMNIGRPDGNNEQNNFGVTWANGTYVGITMNNELSSTLEIARRDGTVGDYVGITNGNWRLKAYFKL